MGDLLLVRVKRTFKPLLCDMREHYSQPKGFVGRNICYAIYVDGKYYGGIVGGSSIANLVRRNIFFNERVGDQWHLETIVNNIFFHVKPIDGKYPFPNFTAKTLKMFRERIIVDWQNKYNDPVVGFETLVELPRKGELYLRDKWQIVGQTIGYTCKRIGGQSSDTWTGKRVWNTTDLRPKLIFCRLR